MWEICSKLTIKPQKPSQWRHSLLLILNIFYTLFSCFHCWLWTSKCKLGRDCPYRVRITVYNTTRIFFGSRSISCRTLWKLTDFGYKNNRKPFFSRTYIIFYFKFKPKPIFFFFFFSRWFTEKRDQQIRFYSHKKRGKNTQLAHLTQKKNSFHPSKLNLMLEVSWNGYANGRNATAISKWSFPSRQLHVQS